MPSPATFKIGLATRNKPTIARIRERTKGIEILLKDFLEWRELYKPRLYMPGVSRKFVCKCGEAKSWITENETTKPCPKCKRKYYGKYNSKTHSIDPIVV